jgi:hypothetical protein
MELVAGPLIKLGVAYCLLTRSSVLLVCMSVCRTLCSVPLVSLAFRACWGLESTGTKYSHLAVLSVN